MNLSYLTKSYVEPYLYLIKIFWFKVVYTHWPILSYQNLVFRTGYLLRSHHWIHVVFMYMIYSISCNHDSRILDFFATSETDLRTWFLKSEMYTTMYTTNVLFTIYFLHPSVPWCLSNFNFQMNLLMNTIKQRWFL